MEFDSAIRMSSLYLAIRSERDREPVLIWPVPRPTARWAIETSSVSPERCDMTVLKPDFLASRTVSIVSDRVPIWLGLIKMALPHFSVMPRSNNLVFVTNKSSPTN